MRFTHHFAACCLLNFWMTLTVNAQSNSPVLKPELRIPIAHNGQITDAQEAPNGKLVASASADGTVKIWNRPTGDLLLTLEGHVDQVRVLDFSPDSRRLVSGDDDGNVFLWDTGTGRRIKMGSHRASVIFVAFSPDGQYVLSAAETYFNLYEKYRNKDLRKDRRDIQDEPIKIWQVATQKEILNWSGQSQVIRLLGFKVDNGTSQKPEAVNYYGVTYGAKSRIFSHFIADTQLKYQISYLPTRNQFVSVDKEGKFEAWDASTNKVLGEITLDSLQKSMQVSDSSEVNDFFDEQVSQLQRFQVLENPGSLVLVSSAKILTIDRLRKKINVFAYKSPAIKAKMTFTSYNFLEMLAQFLQENVEFPGLITHASFTKDNQLLIGDTNGLIRIYSLDGRMIRELTGQREKSVSAVGWGLNTIYTGYWDKSLRKWDLASSNVANQYQHRSKANTILAEPNGNWIYTSSPDLLRFGGFFDDNSGKEKADMWGVDATLWKKQAQLQQFDLRQMATDTATYFCCASVLSPDGSLIASQAVTKEVGSGQGIILVDPKKPTIYYKLTIPYSVDMDDFPLRPFIETRFFSGRFSLDDVIPLSGSSIQFSSDGTLVAAITALNTKIGVWNTKTKAIVHSLDNGSLGLQVLAFKPNGNLLLAGGADGRIHYWFLFNKESISVKGHLGAITDLKFSPDGQTIASASEDRTICLWDFGVETPRKTLKGHKSGISSLAFSPDGKYLLSGSNDNHAKIWKVQTGEEIVSLIAVDSTDWVVVDPKGHFDASPGAMQKMYFVQGLETFNLEQLKERYWIPGLLPSTLGYAPEKRSSALNAHISLPPTVKLALEKDNLLVVSVIRREGGLGKVSFFINSSEKEEDLSKRYNPKRSGNQLTYTIPLRDYQDYFSSQDKNELKILAYDQKNEVSSRGDTLSYWKTTVRGDLVTHTTASPPTVAKASIYGIFIGVNTLGLRYAEKDAQDLHRIFEQAAKRFIPDPKRGQAVFKLFTPAQSDAFQPTKTNIIRYLKSLGDIIKPEDYLLFFFSGHGKVVKLDMEKNKAKDEDDYVILLQGISEAQELTGKNLSSFVKNNLVLSYRQEITPIFNALKAQKRIFCLDACESSEAADFATKSSTLSRERAFNNMYSRTGVYFLASSAKDKASYEDPAFEHGFLSYSMLRGLQSPGLIKFGQDDYIDIPTLFRHTLTDAPKIAAIVKRDQSPVYRTPGQRQDLFLIGRMTDTLKATIQLQQGVKLQLTASEIDDEKGGDPLKLRERLNAALREAADALSPVFLYNQEAVSGAYRLKASYKQKGDEVTIVCFLRRFTTPGDSELVEEFVLTGKTAQISDLQKQLYDTLVSRAGEAMKKVSNRK